ncbi:MAG: hypothetical protein SGPRY_007033, partial [Prymnesium sp.]
MLVEGEAALASQGSAEQGETSKRPSIGCSESSESSSRYSIKRTSSTKQMLETCARQSHKLRLRVSLVCCSLGATIFATMQATALIQGNSEDWDDSNPPKDIWGKLSNLGPPLMLLALRPGDTKMIRLAGFLLIVIVVTTSLFLLVLAVSLNTRNRKVIQKYLKNWDHKAEAQSAASIAQMIGGMKPAEAISFAQ